MNSVDTYIEQFDGEMQKLLLAVRNLVRTEAPEATESITYGLIGYKLKGKPLVYFGGFKHHIGFYATPNGHAAFVKEFARYKQGKGSVQFPNNQPLPINLITRVIRYRKEQVGG